MFRSAFFQSYFFEAYYWRGIEDELSPGGPSTSDPGMVRPRPITHSRGPRKITVRIFQ